MLHIPPPAVRDLTVGEFDHLCAWLDDYARRLKKGAGGD